MLGSSPASPLPYPHPACSHPQPRCPILAWPALTLSPVPSSLLSNLPEIKGCSEANESGLMRTLVIVFLLRLDGRAAAAGKVVSRGGGAGPDGVACSCWDVPGISVQPSRAAARLPVSAP